MAKTVSQKINGFFEQFSKARYKKGQLIISANDKVKNIYFIKKGLIRIFSISKEGEEATLHIARPGSYFPIMLVLGKSDYKYNYDALTNSEVIVAPGDKVIEFIKSDPDVLLNLTEKFAAGICGLLDRIENLIFEDSYRKICLLLDYFADKYGRVKGEESLITLPLTHSSIATWTGLKRETVSRQISKLIKKGVISYKDGMVNIRKKSKLTDQNYYSP